MVYLTSEARKCTLCARTLLEQNGVQSEAWKSDALQEPKNTVPVCPLWERDSGSTKRKGTGKRTETEERVH